MLMIYLEHVPGLIQLSSSLLVVFVLLFLGVQTWRFTLFGEWARLFCMLSPIEFKTNPLAWNTPIVMGGALQDPASSLHEFVQQRRSFVNFLEMKVRNVHAGRLADNLFW